MMPKDHLGQDVERDRSVNGISKDIRRCIWEHDGAFQAVIDVGADSGEIRRGEALHVRLDPSTCIALTPADQSGAAER